MWKHLHEIPGEKLVNWQRKELVRCDPYLVWAEASTKPEATDALNIGVLVELAKARDYPDFLHAMNGQGLINFIPSGLEQNTGVRFITGLVTRVGLERLVRAVVDKRISRFTLQDARDDLTKQGEPGWTDVSQKMKEAEGLVKNLATTRPGTYLGIIDDGLPFARAFSSTASGGAVPVLRLWDQGWQQRWRGTGDASRPGASPPEPNDGYWRNAWVMSVRGQVGGVVQWTFNGFLYGRRLKSLSSSPPAVESDADDDYTRSRYCAPSPRHTHGAAVLGLMAPWLSNAKGPVHWPDEVSGLCMVQLPTRTVSDTSGGSLAMRVLDGLRFILWQERSDRDAASKAARPVVVNVSYGVHAGPHDGTSMAERAFQELLDRHKNLHLVLPAGNAHRIGCHASHVLTKGEGHRDTATLVVRVLPDNPGDTYLEIWLPKGADVVLSMRPPGDSRTIDIKPGEAKIDCEDVPGRRIVYFGAIYPDEVAQSTDRTMALFVIGSTRRSQYYASSAPRGLNQQRRSDVWGQSGIWEVTVRNRGKKSITVDAWIERGDAPPDSAWGGRQAYFPDACVPELTTLNSTPEGTLNGIATLRHERAYVIGAMRVDGRLSDYSAADMPNVVSDKAPRVVTTADWSQSLPGLRTLGFRQGSVARVNGTSAACAVYTRALAKQLHDDPNKLPCGTQPGLVPVEIDCVPERHPAAARGLRGQKRRKQLPFDVFPIDQPCPSPDPVLPAAASTSSCTPPPPCAR